MKAAAIHQKSLILLSALACSLQAEPTIAQQTDFSQVISIAEKAVRNPNLPGGSIRVVRDRKILLDRAFGKADQAGTRDWRTDEVVVEPYLVNKIVLILFSMVIRNEEDSVMAA